MYIGIIFGYSCLIVIFSLFQFGTTSWSLWSATSSSTTATTRHVTGLSHTPFGPPVGGVTPAGPTVIQKFTLDAVCQWNFENKLYLILRISSWAHSVSFYCLLNNLVNEKKILNLKCYIHFPPSPIKIGIHRLQSTYLSSFSND